MATFSVAHCDPGTQKVNEDAWLGDDQASLYVMADGVGGNGLGAVAAGLALDAAKAVVAANKGVWDRARAQSDRESAREISVLLEKIVTEASTRIHGAASKDPTKKGMCSTLDIFSFNQRWLSLAHVGNGRVYLLRAGELHQITDDHTQLAHQKRLGKIEGDQAQLAKRLTRVVGFQPNVKADVLEVELQPGDRIFCCTDGVWFPLGDATLENSVVDSPSENLAVEALVKAVRNTGAKDNFTLAMATPPVRVAAEEPAADVKAKLTGKVAVFEFLTYQEVLQVLAVAEIFKVKAGQTVCKEGDEGSEMMLVVKGAVEVQKAGKRLAALGVGDSFGEMAMLDISPRSASIVATQDTNLLAFPRDALFTLLRKNPELSVKFLWGLSQELNKRLRNTSSQLAGMAAPPAAPKLGASKLPFFHSLAR